MKTIEVKIGNLGLGAHHPVRIQSMTNTDTADVRATVDQCKALAEAGCEMIRITAKNRSDVDYLQKIKETLKHEYGDIPLIADVHFLPEVAESAARVVEKVRINPGNYIDRRSSKATTYGKDLESAEAEILRNRILPLIKICKEYGTAIRVGVNQGSISQRILNQYGDTPEGMVASAMEFIQVFADEKVTNLVLSMKSSNVKTMIYAYRLLAKTMMEKSLSYPLHLGVTEAGAGMEARVKSAAGIGTLLMEGLGDTIRVSLTENPVNEIATAKILVEKFGNFRTKENCVPLDKYSFQKHETHNQSIIGSKHPPVTISCKPELAMNSAMPTDGILCSEEKKIIVKPTNEEVSVTMVSANSFSANDSNDTDLHPVVIDFTDVLNLHDVRNELLTLSKRSIRPAIIMKKNYHAETAEELMVTAGAEFSFLLVDGFVNGIMLSDDHELLNEDELMFSILQSVGLRRTRAEFIACPTCGRTLYNVEETLKKVSKALGGQKHLKIGVMGCVVNGPGEMADADYGYVGAGNGKVNLYKGQQLVLKGIAESEALEQLILLIKENNDWIA